MLQRHFRIPYLQDKILWVIDDILNRHADFYDVFVLSQHDFTQASRANLGRIDLDDLVDQRRIPLKTRGERGMVLTKPEDNSALLFVELIETHQTPDQRHAAKHHAQQRTGESAFSRTTPATTAAEHAGEALLELFKSFIQIRRALIASAPGVAGALVTTPGLIP